MVKLNWARIIGFTLLVAFSLWAWVQLYGLARSVF
jgi:hypothetical protein